MNQKRKLNRGPRPNAGTKPSGHYWHHWYDDCCWDDDCYWDWDDDYDWYYYSAPRKAKAPMPVKAWDENTGSDIMSAYQAGFKDGWYAAMEYMQMYGRRMPMPAPKPMPEPTPPVPTSEGSAE